MIPKEMNVDRYLTSSKHRGTLTNHICKFSIRRPGNVLNTKSNGRNACETDVELLFCIFNGQEHGEDVCDPTRGSDRELFRCISKRQRTLT